MNEMLFNYVRNRANSARANGHTLRVPELASELNQNGFRTRYGSEYRGGRGPLTVVRLVWGGLQDQELEQEAENVALVFVKADGTYAWQQKSEREE
jgi:hypothetical protein